jgi:hypothetical protein
MNATSNQQVLYTAPPLTSEDEVVLGEIHRMRKDLRNVLRTPRRWEGGLRRSALARRAHHMQAQTVARRVGEARQTWNELDALAREHGLPERTLDAMFDAVLGYRVRRGGYMKRTEVTEQTATRDLAALASAGVLVARGNGRGRHYVAGEPLHAIRDRRRAARKPLRDPYPWMRAKLAEPV